MFQKIKPFAYGVLASILLLALYFLILALISGWSYTLVQFESYRYYILSLSLGFGIQVSLYTYLRDLVHNEHGERRVLGVTGTTSTVAMISCCSHYLVNLVPVLGAVGIVTFVAQYQVELFWVGLLFNLGGIIYIANRVVRFKQV